MGSDQRMDKLSGGQADGTMVPGAARLMSQAALVVLVVFAAGVWPSWHWAGDDGLRAMSAAVIICLTAAMVSLAPTIVALRRQADWLAQALLGGTLIRLLTTLVLGGAVWLALQPAKVVFGVWLVIFYLTLLAWETLTAVRLIKAHYRSVVSKCSKEQLRRGEKESD